MTRRVALTVVIVTATILAPAGTQAREAGASGLGTHTEAPSPSGQWSMFMNGPRHQGRTPLVGPQSANVAWSIPTETNYGGPVIGRDGTIYQGTMFGRLWALRPNGTMKWFYSVPYGIESTPAILLDGRIAFVDDDGDLHVLNRDGSLSWEFLTHTPCGCPVTSPVIGGDGTVYTAIGEVLYALHPDGTTRWTYDPGRTILAPPAVRADGVVYLTASYLYAIDQNGSLIWKTPDLVGLASAPVISGDGTIYVNGFDPALYAFNPDGSTKWIYRVDTCCYADVAATPAIGPDGTIYIGETLRSSGAVLALDLDGTLKWQADYGDYGYGFAVDRQGTIYFGATTNPGPPGPAVYALDPDGSLKWEYDAPSGGYVRTPPAIGRGGFLYVGGGAAFFAIGSGPAPANGA